MVTLQGEDKRWMISSHDFSVNLVTPPSILVSSLPFDSLSMYFPCVLSLEWHNFFTEMCKWDIILMHNFNSSPWQDDLVSPVGLCHVIFQCSKPPYLTRQDFLAGQDFAMARFSRRARFLIFWKLVSGTTSRCGELLLAVASF